MRIGIVSDTHGATKTTQMAVRTFEALRVDQVIHCGDIGPADIISLFSGWPTHFVFGNIDDPVMLREAIDAAGQTCHERFGHLIINGRSVAFLHGDDGALLWQTIRCGQWHVVCHGHTHIAAKSFEGPTLVVNPGAIQHTGSPSVAMVELPSLEVIQISL